MIKKVACGRCISGIVGLAFACLVGCNKVPPPVVSSKPPEVIVETPSSQTVLDFEDFIGRTEGIPYVEIRARVSGELKQILFKDGADVKEGDPLFEIDPRPFDLEVKRTTAALAKAEATMNGKNALFKIADKLRKDGNKNLSQEEYEIAEAAYKEAKADRDQAIENKKLAVLNESFCHVTAPISNPPTDKTITYRASRKKLDVGNLVMANVTPLTTIVALDPIYANFDPDERTLLRLRRLLEKKEIPSARDSIVKVQVGLADEPGFSLTGIIEFVEHSLDPGTGTLRVRIRIDNPPIKNANLSSPNVVTYILGILDKIRSPGSSYLLSPNMFVRIRFPVGYPHPALLVPEQALVSDQGIRHLFVLNANDEAIYRPVELGLQQGEMRVITKGLEPTDRVIVSGLQRVRPGIKVTPKTAVKSSTSAGL